MFPGNYFNSSMKGFLIRLSHQQDYNVCVWHYYDPVGVRYQKCESITAITVWYKVFRSEGRTLHTVSR